MISVDENALICDLAETYHIYDYRSLPVKLVATLAAGLREDARIKLKMAGTTASRGTIILGTIADRLGLLIYSLSKGNGEVPESIAETFYVKEKKESTYRVFDSPEAFREAWLKITGGHKCQQP